MNAIVMNEYGGPEVLKFADYPDPTPGPGDVLIKVAAARRQPNRFAAAFRRGEGFFSSRVSVDYWLGCLRDRPQARNRS